jgi:two-component system, cell cycle sensor histidine kinase and response regulator CckA
MAGNIAAFGCCGVLAWLSRRLDRELAWAIRSWAGLYFLRVLLSIVDHAIGHSSLLLCFAYQADLWLGFLAIGWFAVRASKLPTFADYARVNTELRRQLSQVERLETIGTLAGGIAHDFNNMLTAILGYTELAEVDPSRLREHLAEAKKATLAASRLTSQLLAFGKRAVDDPVVVDLALLVNEIQSILRRSIGERITVRISIVAGLWKIWAPHAQIEQIIMNLAINARDAMPSGGILGISLANEASNHRNWVLITVSDTGIGMDEETAKRIFEPFFTTKERGTGLGLLVVRKITGQLGGTIEVETSPGHGTVMKVRFPKAVTA